jgi:hypothetical protein
MFEQAFLDGVEELFGLFERQAQVFNAFAGFLQADLPEEGF